MSSLAFSPHSFSYEVNSNIDDLQSFKSLDLQTKQVPVEAYFSNVEAAVLRSTNPIEIDEIEEISVFGHTGIWTNRQEVNDWRGMFLKHSFLCFVI